MSDGIRRGDVIFMRGFKKVVKTTIYEASFTYPKVKGKRDVFLYLGQEDDEGPPFDPNAALETMGWKCEVPA